VKGTEDGSWYVDAMVPDCVIIVCQKALVYPHAIAGEHEARRPSRQIFITTFGTARMACEQNILARFSTQNPV
jgi:hypothetical protein